MRWIFSGSAGGISNIDLDVLHNEVASRSSHVLPEPTSIAAIALFVVLVSRPRKLVQWAFMPTLAVVVSRCLVMARPAGIFALDLSRLTRLGVHRFDDLFVSHRLGEVCAE